MVSLVILYIYIYIYLVYKKLDLHSGVSKRNDDFSARNFWNYQIFVYVCDDTNGSRLSYTFQKWKI